MKGNCDNPKCGRRRDPTNCVEASKKGERSGEKDLTVQRRGAGT